ncbi:MAG: uracil-DNA glycosylase [Thermoprotei archaeon]|nr:uracil-DNA glycosylase [TACK group archaeon]
MVARQKKKEFASWEYWGRPVPGFGDPHAKLMVVGLAPAAHGGNRTGRMFTGDSSGQWLARALYRVGLANQPTSTSKDDGLSLKGVFLTAVTRCAPPKNRPLPAEILNCRPYLLEEIRLIDPRAYLALGRVALAGLFHAFSEVPPPFSHGKRVVLRGKPVIMSYHPSRQNTNTGRLTEQMLDLVVMEAKQAAGL